MRKCDKEFLKIVVVCFVVWASLQGMISAFYGEKKETREYTNSPDYAYFKWDDDPPQSKKEAWSRIQFDSQKVGDVVLAIEHDVTYGLAGLRLGEITVYRVEKVEDGKIVGRLLKELTDGYKGIVR